MSRVCVGHACLLVDTGGKSKGGVIFSNKLGVVCLRYRRSEWWYVELDLGVCGKCGKMGSSG